MWQTIFSTVYHKHQAICDTYWADEYKYGIPPLSSDSNWKNHGSVKHTDQYTIKEYKSPMHNINVATLNSRDVVQCLPLTTCKIISFLYLWYTAWWWLVWSDQNMQMQSAIATLRLCIDGLCYFIMCFRNSIGMPHLKTQTNVLRQRGDILHFLPAALQPPLVSRAMMQTSCQCMVKPPNWQQSIPRAFQEDKLGMTTYQRSLLNTKKQFWYLGMWWKQSWHHSRRYTRTCRR
jgi:hypothetical protein